LEEEDRMPASTVSATEAQNNFGRVLGQAADEGVVYITRYDRPPAVVMSIERYRSLTEPEPSGLDELTREFDEMFAGMQTARSAEAFDALFEKGSKELGDAAARGARRRRG
jgi:prevent-host-death family protein